MQKVDARIYSLCRYLKMLDVKKAIETDGVTSHAKIKPLNVYQFK